MDGRNFTHSLGRMQEKSLGLRPIISPATRLRQNGGLVERQLPTQREKDIINCAVDCGFQIPLKVYHFLGEIRTRDRQLPVLRSFTSTAKMPGTVKVTGQLDGHTVESVVTVYRGEKLPWGVSRTVSAPPIIRTGGRRNTMTVTTSPN